MECKPFIMGGHYMESIEIQSGTVVITQPNMSRYHIQPCNDNGKSDLELATNTPSLALTGQLWGVDCKHLGLN